MTHCMLDVEINGVHSIRWLFHLVDMSVPVYIELDDRCVVAQVASYTVTEVKGRV